jgi:hypothetical protein
MSEVRDEEVHGQLRAEVGAWHPERGADLRDLMRRVEREAMRPVFLASLAGTAALAVVLVLCVAIVSLPSLFPGAEAIRAHLLGIPSTR